MCMCFLYQASGKQRVLAARASNSLKKYQISRSVILWSLVKMSLSVGTLVCVFAGSACVYWHSLRKWFQTRLMSRWRSISFWVTSGEKNALSDPSYCWRDKSSFPHDSIIQPDIAVVSQVSGKLFCIKPDHNLSLIFARQILYCKMKSHRLACLFLVSYCISKAVIEALWFMFAYWLWTFQGRKRTASVSCFGDQDGP